MSKVDIAKAIKNQAFSANLQNAMRKVFWLGKLNLRESQIAEEIAEGVSLSLERALEALEALTNLGLVELIEKEYSSSFKLTEQGKSLHQENKRASRKPYIGEVSKGCRTCYR